VDEKTVLVTAPIYFTALEVVKNTRVVMFITRI